MRHQHWKELYDWSVHGQLHDIGVVGVASPFCGTLRLLKEVAPPWTGLYIMFSSGCQMPTTGSRAYSTRSGWGYTLIGWSNVICLSWQRKDVKYLVFLWLKVPSCLHPLPGTTLDIIQDELMEIAGGATQQYRSPNNSGVTSPHNVQHIVLNNPLWSVYSTPSIHRCGCVKLYRLGLGFSS